MAISNKPFKATVKKIEHKEKFTQAQLTTSQKNYKFDENEEVDNETNPKYLYSSWGFVTFVGKAHQFMMSDVEEGDLVTVLSSQFSHESYIKDGNRTWGAPKLLVFDLEMTKKASGKAVEHASEDEEGEEEYPF